ncbi:hypothetical protein OROMI_014410 [Orobanche minor]
MCYQDRRWIIQFGAENFIPSASLRIQTSIYYSLLKF